MKDFLVANPYFFEILLTLVSIIAGAFGALLGLGGGFLIIPFLTLALGIHIHYAIGAGLVAVIATSSGAAAGYVRDGYTNVRLALFLEIATTLGAITGVIFAGIVAPESLYLIFALLLTWSAWSMFRRRDESDISATIPPDGLADRLKLHSTYPAQGGNRRIAYRVTRTPLGLVLMYFAGIATALLGIGSGTLKVPAMDQAMRLPIKVSTATSNFMIGVTAATSAGIYFMRGNIIPGLAGPVALGVLIGSQLGGHLLTNWSGKTIRWIFVIVLIVVAVQMGMRGYENLSP